MKTIDQLILELNNLGIKLWVEEDALRYRAGKGALTPEIKAELKEKKAEIITFLKSLQELNQTQTPPITIIPRTGELPLSSSQKNLWLQHQLDPDNPINNMPYVYRLTGKLELNNLEKAQNEIIRRHEILRTHFSNINGQPTLVIQEKLELPIAIFNLENIAPELQEKEARELANKESCQSFDLENGPLIRLTLIRLQEDNQILIINFHRIVCDGGSTGIFFQELLKIYQAFCENKPSPFADLPIQYLDYSAWSNQFLKEDVLQSELNYWQKQLGTNLPTLNLPTDYPRPSLTTYEGSRRYLLMPPSVNSALNNLSQQSGCTLFMTLVAAINILLSRYASQNDVVICFSHSGRGKVELEGLIGAFTKTLPIRTFLDDQLTFRQLLKIIKESALGADAHYNIPFDTLIEQFPSSSNDKRSPLLQVIFALNPPWKGEDSLSVVKLPELTITSLFGYVYIGKTKFDLGLVMRDTDQGLRAVFEYNSDLFDGNSISKMLICFQTLLTNIVADPDRKISEFSLVTEEEKQQLLIDWNKTDLELPKITNIAQQIETQVTKNPEQIAVIINKQKLTYQELNQKANQLAYYLQSLGIKEQTKIAICLEQSPLMMITILGILKVGGIVIPLEITDLTNRKNEILKTSHSSFLITVDPLKSEFSESALKIINLDRDQSVINQQNTDNIPCAITPQNTAWINYISTCDSKQKGVIISHENIIAQSYGLSKTLELTEKERILHLSVQSFSNIIEAIFPPLLTGSTIVLKTIQEVSSIKEFCQTIKQEKINILNIPTTFWYEMLKDLATVKSNLSKDLRLIMIGGEKLSPKAYQTWIQEIGEKPRLLNAYGTTESTMTALTYELNPNFANQKLPLNLPIGKPIFNNKIYILDNKKQPLPVGVPGQLYLGGIGITQGYDQDDLLTAEKFISNPFNPEEKLYQTGDIARYLADGNIEFRGRMDQQIKFNGLRIQPEEIELILQQHPQIDQAVVILQEDLKDIDLDKDLIAYLVTKSGENLTEKEIFAYLNQHLSTSIVPSKIIFLDSLPSLANGQINPQALEALKTLDNQSEKSFVAPRNTLEIELGKIWQEVLKLDKISINDNFFDLGGQSLLAIQVVAKIQQELKIDLPLRQMLETPTIAKLAESIEHPLLNEKTSDSPFPVTITPLRKKGSKFPLYFIHIEQESFISPFVQYLNPEYPLYSISNLGEIMAGLLANKFDSFGAAGISVKSLATQYVDALLKFQPEGPYYLLGISFGGIVAYEMAQQLTAMGRKVDDLILLDTANPLATIKSRSKKRLMTHFKRLMQFGPGYIKNRIPWQISRFKYWLSKKSDKLFGKKLFDLTPLIIHDILKYHGQLQRGYIPQKYEGKVTMILAEYEDSSHKDIWQKLTDNKLNTISVPGTHLGIFEEPNVQILIQKIETLMFEDQEMKV